MLTECSAHGAVRAAPAARAAAWRALLVAVACVLQSGCGTLYLMQAAAGQWRLLRSRVPIDRVLADPHTPAALRSRLAEVDEARAFASRELGLPDNRSYRSYADIGRRYVVWNVVAAPEFSLRPKRWCFPVAGCVAYRGYFDEQRARDFAAALAVRGYDVVVEGVPAYSTLGAFADPVLSSMLRYGDDELIATIFHELAHQLLYVRGDSRFNEAFATTVEDAGLERWLEYRGAGERIGRFREEQSQEAALLALVSRCRTRLAKLYASGLAVAAMRERKAALLAQLAADIGTLEGREAVRFPLYDRWIDRGLNNAELASVATYYECLPGFQRLLAEQGGDLGRFYAAARRLARAGRTERDAQLCGPAAAPPPVAGAAPR
ncbi:MAG TPA: aminopeptidase [Steroidobacteraceae bacterium]|nr:aminopeptidase [Steroidobacteraceae bacterium]